MRIAITVEERLHQSVLLNEGLRSAGIEMVGEKIQLHPVLCGIGKETLRPLVVLAQSRTANFEIGKT